MTQDKAQQAEQPLRFQSNTPSSIAGIDVHGSIVLTTINAKYIHASLGLRYLYANMGKLQSSTTIQEFTIQGRAADIAESLLQNKPDIIGIGVYIWNVQLSTEVIQLVKTVSPDTIVIAGGPELTAKDCNPAIADCADYVIFGAADHCFAETCQAILNDQAPNDKLIHSSQAPLSQLEFPYQYYHDEDLKNRIVYVEASRGCPFKCEFCLSSLDKTAWPFDTDTFLQQMATLHERGLRSFKFVDRTFNLKVSVSQRILEFFLARLSDDLFLHFEVIPDKLPDKLKEILPRFPPGTLQFEVGIQSFNPDVQQTINRRQDNVRSIENLHWLRSNTQAHIHADLIFGLPGETLQSFAEGFDQLVALQPQEIQLGILKMLPGTPLARHTETFQMRYSSAAPYGLLCNRDIDFQTVQRINRFARYWDLVANSGRFKYSLPLLLANEPFNNFLIFSDWCYSELHRTHNIRPEHFLELIYTAALQQSNCDPMALRMALQQDADRLCAKLPARFSNTIQRKFERRANRASRQQRHL